MEAGLPLSSRKLGEILNFRCLTTTDFDVSGWMSVQNISTESLTFKETVALHKSNIHKVKWAN